MLVPLSVSAIAPRNAWRLLQGERPWRVRASHPPVSRLASLAESWRTPRRTRGATRRQRLLSAVGVTAPPDGLVPRRETLAADAAGGHAPRRPPKRLRGGEEAPVRRSPQAAAGRKRGVDARGRPHRRWRGGSVAGWERASEARAGQPGHGTLPEPQRRRDTPVRPAEQDGARESPLAASGASSHAEASAGGHATALGKDVTEGRRPPRTLAPDPGGSEARQPPARRGRADTAKADTPPRWRARSRGLDVELLLDGWGARHKEAARGVEGGPGQRSAAPLQAQVEALGERLQQKRYRVQVRRRRARPKGNGQERP
jgi:hypothetical protein